MKNLFLTLPEDRDAKWEELFFKGIVDAQFTFLSETPIEGPDGMAYLAVEVADSDGEPAQNVFKWLGEKGVGLVINPGQQNPDYVFSYGMIWNFLTNGEFMTAQEAPLAQGEIEMKPGQEMMAGTPSETYWPLHARKIFKEFLRDQGVHNPRIVMLSQDSKNYDLCFSLESLGNPPQEEWQGLLQAFSWFFPLHYSFSIISEDMIQGIEFISI